MSDRQPRSFLVVGLLFTLACGDDVDLNGTVEGHTLALNACDETVPANRYIDGLPAYAQCSAFQSGAIYSNNGVDTSGTKVGSDWQQTQMSGGYQCTELVHRYWLFKWNVRWLPRGNAGTWCDAQPPASSGVVQTMTPVHGDAVVLAPGSCGANAGTGHVALIDVVDGARLAVVEQNPARRGTYQQSCAKCFLHVVANDGSLDGGTAKPAPGEGGSAQPRTDGGAVRSDAGSSVLDAAAPANDPFVPPSPAGDAGALTGAATGPGTDASVGDASSSAALEAGAPAASSDKDESAGCTLGRSAGREAPTWSWLPLAALLWGRRRSRTRE